ncbi:uncharacterized protein CLAFUR5_06535 [Fulvia fulva]|uniref:Uncharacterized protein n=1 Tax=Passalora fulva TaxID=5499 RepID=A0A9Q8LHK8_PASFU|nr:uncharacterized protein CLAFUR5_06535 [Fulvia fulva]KAK4624878.1 hypothetical protein CLAFUR0_06395 [Fulvia fulva]UJO17547.1 hypothetical protein CLAFUR5_06535 [Fulvia fulva]WPV30434.1 hypothetical protein CLAFUW7_06389 [Fulvia fulva]
MLSRSNSNAADRLQRAKSNSSAHTATSSHHRQSTNIEPYVGSQQHAEAAAIEAHRRAQEVEHPTSRPVPPKLQRRRSQKDGTSQGSHFEIARRKSLARADDEPRVRPVSCLPSPSKPITSIEETQEGTIITRRRSVIPPLAEPKLLPNDPASSASTSARQVRRRQSAYTEGSPQARSSQTIQDPDATLQLPDLGADPAGIFHLRKTPDYRPSAAADQRATRSRRPSLRETQTDEDIRNMARDEYLQDLHAKRLRERKSFMLAPFQKRRATTTATNLNSSLPPFNYANDGNAAPLPVNPAFNALKPEKSRKVSDTIKGRLKKVFRKVSKPISLPPQHIEANDLHYTVRQDDVSDAEVNPVVDCTDPFMTATAETLGPPAVKFNSTQNSNNGSQESLARSRVTSWTTSTVAGMNSTRTRDGPFAQGDDATKVRKRSSFFGRPIQNKLRRTSRTDLKGSEESQSQSHSLYEALQKVIRPSNSIDPPRQEISISPPIPPRPDTITSRESTSSARALLPSQQRCSISAESYGTSLSSTIRPISPLDPAEYGAVNIPSPIKEVTSPGPDYNGADEQSSPERTPGGGLKRRTATKSSAPSQEQLTRRMERHKNRWQSPLDEIAPQGGQSARKMMPEDNPYEMRSLSQSMRNPVPHNDLPYHANLGAPRMDALSPSVYSRGTDGASPRPLTPDDVGMTTITITSREVRKYDISPGPKHGDATKRIQGSREWRKWLSDEICNFTPAQQVAGGRPGSLSPTM